MSFVRLKIGQRLLVSRFHRRNFAPPSPPVLKLYNQNIAFQATIKYLGMIFDQKLTWKDHSRSLIQECHKTLGLLKTLAHHHWGSDSEMLVRLYRSLIRSKIDYGCLAFSSAKSSGLAPLNSLHNYALRIATGAFRTTPVTSPYCLAAEPSLLLRRDFLLLSYSLKVAADVAYPLRKLLFSRRSQLIFTQKKSPYALVLTVLCRCSFVS